MQGEAIMNRLGKAMWLSCVTLASMPAFGQDAVPIRTSGDVLSTDGSEQGGIADIIVTAQRRTENA